MDIIGFDTNKEHASGKGATIYFGLRLQGATDILMCYSN
jgi:hypothetical protein